MFTVAGDFGFVSKENSIRELTYMLACYRDATVFTKLHFKTVFREKPAFSNSPGLRSVFKKLRFSHISGPARGGSGIPIYPIFSPQDTNIP